MAKEVRFDEAYYARYYGDSRLSTADVEQANALGDFVRAYLKYLEQPVCRVLANIFKCALTAIVRHNDATTAGA